MTSDPGHDDPVVVVATARRDAVRWAAGYAHRRGSPLLVLHLSPLAADLLDDLRGRHPGLRADHRFVADALGDALVTESEHAHAIVVDDAGEEVFDGESVVTALSALAGCPVVSVPPGATWQEQPSPVIVGVHHLERTPQKLEFSFAEAQRLGTGVRLVRCASPRRSVALLELLAELAARYPDVPVHSEVLAAPAPSALAWHAHFGAMVVVGSRSGGTVRGALFRSIKRAVLRHGGSPVVVIGKRVRRSAAVPELGSARS
jgi:hypothetical protein